MNPAGSLQCSQNPATELLPLPVESDSCLRNPDTFTIILVLVLSSNLGLGLPVGLVP